VGVLFILISAVWLIIALIGVAMCRLAGLSDDSHVEALAEWIATNCIVEDRALPVDSATRRVTTDARFRAYRATG
jgi:hypothetical protein